MQSNQPIQLSETDKKIIYTIKEGALNGKTTKEMARSVFMSKRSFDAKVAGICNRLGLDTNRGISLIVFAYEKRLIAPESEINAQKYSGLEGSEG